MKKETKKSIDAKVIRRKAEELLKKKHSNKSVALTETETIKLVHELEVHQIELEMQKEELELAKEKAETNAEKYTNLYDYSPDGKFTLNSNGEICELNFNAAKMLNKERSKLINSNFNFFIALENRSLFIDFLDRISGTNTKQNFEARLVINEKPSTFIHIEGILLENEKKYLLTAFDISKQKHAENELIKAKEKAEISEKYLDNIINNIGDPIFVKNENSILTLVNDAFCTLFEKERDDIIGKTLAEDVALDEKEEFLKIDKQVLRTGEENINEESITVKGKPTRTISTRKARYINPNNEKYLIGVIRDITKRKESEKELRASEERITIFTQNVPDFLLQIDSTGKINYINKTLEGLTQKDVIGSSVYSWIPEEFSEEFKDKVAKVFRSGGSEIMEYRGNGLKGEPIWFESKIGPFEKSGIITQVIIVSRDITERKKVEEELRKTAQLLEASQTVAKLGGWELDLATKDLFWTSETYHIHETSPDEFNPTVDAGVSYFLPESRQIISEALQVAMERGEGYDLELETYTTKGRLISVRTTCEVTLKEGKPVKLTGIFQDITERKAAEEHLKKTFSQLNLVVKTAKLGVWSFDVNTGEVTWNDRQYEIHGIAPSEFDLTLESYNNFVHPEDLEYLFDQQAEVYKNKSVYDINFRIIRPDKEVRYINASATPVNIDGELDRIIGVNEDITERKKSEKELKNALNKLTELKQEIEAENIYLKEELKLEGSFDEIVGSSKSLRKVLKEVEQVAKTDSTVLILGETGTGKELIAKAIHEASERKHKPLIKVNCSALPANLIESELFGHEKGAFTGAINRKIGRFELANGGTLFLDEIGDLPVGLQSRLLRVLQESEFERVGGEKTIKIDVRIITATNRNLANQVLENKFRQDLYYRLKVFPITCPPLRERIDDIASLVHHFVNKYNHKVNNKIKTVNQKTIERLMHYNWPGNIRELEHVIERAVIVNQGGQLRLGNWFMDGKFDNVVSDDLTTLETVERDYIIKVLEITNWKIRGKNGAAEILGLKPTTLESRMKKRDIRR
ncbi:MAG: sigma 54-interacting transcriptional regulator [Psychroserpens sp.]|uniref:sigma 54-interacting transcriptional regulator n=1 Tax=Psychroserpens sp. TaxID=2020870 RepID=UPI003001033B